MFTDHRGGRHRTTWENGDNARFAHKHPSLCAPGEQCYTGFKIEKAQLSSLQAKIAKNLLPESSHGHTVILNDIIPFEAPVKIVTAKYYDTRLTQLADIHRYIIEYNDEYFYVTEYDLK